jgi:hypothetical protein
MSENPENTGIPTKLNLLFGQMLRNENSEVLPDSRINVGSDNAA